MSESYSSIFFRNTNSSFNYLTSPANNSNLILTGNFTIEFWIKCPTQSRPYPTIMGQNAGWTPSTLNNYNICVQHSYVGGNGLVIVWSGAPGTNQVIKGVKALNDNVWHHVAIVRSGTVVTNYVDGIFDTSGTSSGTWNFGTGGITFGNNPGDNSSGMGLIGFNGYLFNIRIVNGTAVYTSNFTSPTSVLTAITGTALLLNGSGSSFVDSSIYNITMTPSSYNPTVSTSIIPSFPIPVPISKNILSGFNVNGVDLGTILNTNATVSFTTPLNSGYYMTVSGSQYDITRVYNTPSSTPTISSGITTGFVTPSGYDLGKVMTQQIYSSPGSIVSGSYNGNISSMSVDSSNNIYFGSSSSNAYYSRYCGMYTASGWNNPIPGDSPNDTTVMNVDSSQNKIYAYGSGVRFYNNTTKVIRNSNSLNNTINVITVDKNNKFYFGGTFTAYTNGNGAGLIDSGSGSIAGFGGTANTIKGLGGSLTSQSCNAIAVDPSNTNIVYAGGYFNNSIDASVNCIGLWNTTTETWSRLAWGFNNACNGIAVDSSNSYVYACGNFTADGLGNIRYLAIWNGSVYDRLTYSLDNNIYALLNDAKTNSIYVAGSFTKATTGVSVQNVIKTDGKTWSPVPSSLSSKLPFPSGSRTLACDNSNNIYFVTSITPYCGRWNVNTNTWTSITGMTADGALEYCNMTCDSLNNFYLTSNIFGSNYVYKVNANTTSAVEIAKGFTGGTGGLPISIVADSSNNIYVGSKFLTISGGNLTVNSIAKWDGSKWSSLGSGIGSANTVYCMAVDFSTNHLYVGGSFTTVSGGTVTVNNITRWDGNTWNTLGVGVTTAATSRSSLALDNSKNLYMVGDNITNVGGGTYPASTVFKWNGSVWSGVGTPSDYTYFLSTLFVDRSNRLYAFGLNSTPYYWNGTNWRKINNGTSSGCYAMTSDLSNNLYLTINSWQSGYYINPINLNNIAKWQNNIWNILGDLSAGFNQVCYTIKTDSSSNIYAGGAFTIAGNANANRIAMYNGTTWSPLGGGLDNSCNSIAIDSANNVYAGGLFITASGTTVNSIGKWNGSVWSALGTGLSGLTKNYCNAIAIDTTNNVYVGGNFISAGGTVANYIAKWDGSTWSALGSGLNNTCNTIAIDTSNTLYAGGAFTTAGGTSANYIAKWNGTSWSALSTGLDNSCNSIYIDTSTNYVYATGFFLTAGGNTVNRFAKWNGTSWSAINYGLLSTGYAITKDVSNNFYVGGEFTDIVQTPINYAARWNGSTWNTLGNFTDNKLDGSCNCIAFDSCNNIVYVGGNFTTINGGTMTTNYLAKWNANTNLWSGCGYGVNAPVKSLQLVNNGNKVNVYAGGNFSEYAIANTSLSGNFYKWNYASSNWSITSSGLTNRNIYCLTSDLCNNLYAGGSSITSGGTTQYIAKLSSGSSTWSMSSGINGTCYCIATDTSNNIYAGGGFTSANYGLNALFSFKNNFLSQFPNTFNGNAYVIRYDKYGNLYAAGYFSTPGNNIAKWNGITWSPLGTGVSDFCYAIAFDNANNLYAGGYFLTAGGVTVNRIAKWDGTTWSALGSGLNGYCFAIEFDNANNLYAGGQFSTAGGVTVNRIARWDGTGWYALKTGLNSTCYSIAIDSNNNVYASGDYTLADSVANTARIAKWDGSNWSALGSGINNSACYSIAFDSSNNLYATGTFSQAGGVASTAYVAKWNGTAWSALGTGFDKFGYSIYVDTSTNNVYASGAFTAAGGNAAAKYAGIWNGTSWSAIGQGFTNAPPVAYRYITKDPSSNILIGGFGTNATTTITVSNIAKWNDVSWSTVGTTLGSTCYAITYDTSRNLLYAAGSFTTPTARIAQWNGTTWSAMGTGITNGTCYSLALDASYNLYAGGNFTTAGGVTNANYIAKWDGSSWSALGTGLIGTGCYSIAIDSTNNIYTGGWAINKPAILKWDTSWCSLGNYNLTNTTIVPSTGTTSLKIDNYNNLYATNTTHLNGFSRWNGSTWNDMGAIYPFFTYNAPNYSSITNDMCNNIYVSTRETSSTVKTNTAPLIITSWNGTVVSTVGSANFNDICCAIAVDSNNNIYVGGCFTKIGSLQVNCIAMWNGTTWSSLGTGLNGACCTITIDSTNNVYVGGNFSTAGGVRVNYIAKWNGTAWSALSSGLSSSCASIALDTSGNLYAGGYFTVASGITVNFIAKWNGTAWSAMGTGLSTGGCSSVAVDTSNNVFAGGYFTVAGGTTVNYIAKWNGTVWSALSSGLSNGCSSIVIDKSNNVYAGGYFTAAGTVNSLYIMKWNGTTWSAMGTAGLNEPCNVLAVDTSNNVYAGGNFVSAGGVYANRLAQWNGTTWSDPFPNTFSSEVLAIGINKNNNTLYIANGMFQRFPANGIALVQ